ncbi:MAG: folate-binding protein YgfZ [Deltaproteobacteria bacterium]|nr:folate-binding protein YgfZ [Deltaproteobacteria bacterium]
MRQLTARDEAILDAVQTRCAVFGRDELLAVRVSGRDAVKFLHAMITQDVKALSPAGADSACLCDPQGAILATLLVVVHGSEAVLWTDRSRAAGLVDALDRYVIADDVTLLLDESVALCEWVGPMAPALAQAIFGAEAQRVPTFERVAGHSVLSWRADLATTPSPWWQAAPRYWMQVDRDALGDVAAALVEAGAQPGSHAAREALRVACGEPRLGLDVDDGSLPLEVGLAAAVSFRKGCYLGQEAIAMMKYRGQPRRYLAWVSGEVAAPDVGAGWLLRTAEGKRAGRLGTCVRATDGTWRGLAVVQRKMVEHGARFTAHGEAEDEPATVTLVATTMPLASETPAGQGPSP